MPVTTIRLPTIVDESITLMALMYSSYLSISLPMGKKPKEVERLLLARKAKRLSTHIGHQYRFVAGLGYLDFHNLTGSDREDFHVDISQDTFDSRPTRRIQNDHRNLSRRKILLMLQVLIRRDQDIKAFSLCGGQEVSVRQGRPTQLKGCRYICGQR